MNTGMFSAPTISIITVCRNSAATISKTIDSVLAQKDTAVEYLVIDGASTDGTQDIIRSYYVIDHIISESDEGIADAFNKGIRLSTGAIIGMINSDDRLLPGAVETVRKFFNENPGVDVFHADVLLYDGNHFVKRIRPAGKWWYPWRLVLFNHPATFVRRTVYERGGLYDNSYNVAMDVEIFLRWMKCGVRIKYLPEVLVRMQSGGMSGQRALEGYGEVRKALRTHRFSPFLATVQYLARCALQVVVILQRKLLRPGRHA